MTIIDFYQELSMMLEEARAGRLSETKGLEQLDKMLLKAKESGLEVNISRDIFKFNNLVRFDDERSYVEEEYSYNEDDTEGYDIDSSYDPL